jgi:hypothetical protein
VLQVRNATPFKAVPTVLVDRDGVDTMFAIIKGTFTLEPEPRIADEQIPVAIAAEHHGEPATSSIKRPSDVSLEKPGTDVILLGHAYASGGRPVQAMDISIAVGPLEKAVRVFGDRRWEGNGATYSMTSPEPFVIMPLSWERAFGGSDVTDDGPREEPRNPVGTGYRSKNGIEPVDGLHLPNLEDPADLITSWKQTPAPAGVGAVEAHWEPRRSYAGTYDDDWQKTRSPYLPLDFDPRFLQLAAPGLSTSGHLQGGERVELRGLTPEGSTGLRLPAPRLRVAFVLDGTPNERPAVIDTVILEPSAHRLSVVWRAAMTCDKKALRISHVAVSLADHV